LLRPLLANFYRDVSGSQLKTTPPTSDSPAALQPGNWGVDVVETQDGAEFLRSIDWDKMIADKPPENIFRIEQLVN
jgi:hypothetical protein